MALPVPFMRKLWLSLTILFCILRRANAQFNIRGSGLPPQSSIPGSGLPPQSTIPGIALPPQSSIPGSGLPPQSNIPGSGLAPQSSIPASGLPSESNIPGSGLAPQSNIPESGLAPQSNISGSGLPPQSNISGTGLPPQSDLPAGTGLPPQIILPGTGLPPPNIPPAVFVFGDSLVDTGNNNYIQSLARANLLFNGIDFPDGPTGRFCNGRTVVDILCDIIGAPYPPAFLNPITNGSRILRGVNYASGAGGILDSTGANFHNRICMNQQISFFQDKTLVQLEAQLGTNATATLLSLSLVAIIIGSNDFINNFLLEDTNIASQYTPEQFNILLLNSFSRQIKALYDLGFRKFYVSAIGPIGCIPHQLALSGQPNCVTSVNAQAQDFNAMVRSMLLQDLNSALPGAMFIFGEAYNSLTAFINNPRPHGFRVVNQGCCGGGRYRGQIVCQPAAQLCMNRAEYVFWDPYHPTEASNRLLAAGIYSGGISQVTPMNIQQLLALPV